MSNYTARQLRPLGEDLQTKFFSEDGDTKTICINEESAQEIISFLSKRYNLDTVKIKYVNINNDNYAVFKDENNNFYSDLKNTYPYEEGVELVLSNTAIYNLLYIGDNFQSNTGLPPIKKLKIVKTF